MSKKSQIAASQVHVAHTVIFHVCESREICSHKRVGTATLTRPIIPRQAEKPTTAVKGDHGPNIVRKIKQMGKPPVCVWCERYQGTKLSRVNARVTPRPPALAERAVSLLSVFKLNCGVFVDLRFKIRVRKSPHTLVHAITHHKSLKASEVLLRSKRWST